MLWSSIRLASIHTVKRCLWTNRLINRVLIICMIMNKSWRDLRACVFSTVRLMIVEGRRAFVRLITGGEFLQLMLGDRDWLAGKSIWCTLGWGDGRCADVWLRFQIKMAGLAEGRLAVVVKIWRTARAIIFLTIGTLRLRSLKRSKLSFA